MVFGGVCSGAGLCGNDNFFLLSRKKGTRNLLFACVGVHISCIMIHSRDL